MRVDEEDLAANPVMRPPIQGVSKRLEDPLLPEGGIIIRGEKKQTPDGLRG